MSNITPEYLTLFSDVQDYVCEKLNTDYQLSVIGIEFVPEHIKDIEFQIKKYLGQQGIIGIVNTVKGQYGGHDGSGTAWECEVEVDVLENPPIRRALMKKSNLSVGTVTDCLNFIEESLGGPGSSTYGQFCPGSIEVGEDSGIVVGKATFKTYAITDISAVLSGESHWKVPYALTSDISALNIRIDQISADIPTKTSQLSNDSGYLTKTSADNDYLKKTYGEEDVLWSLTDTDLTVRLETDDSVFKINSDYYKSQYNSKYYSITNKNRTSQLFAIGLTDENDYQFRINEQYLVHNILGGKVAIDSKSSVSVDLSSVYLPDKGKSLDETIPTKTSQLSNDSGYLTKTSADSDYIPQYVGVQTPIYQHIDEGGLFEIDINKNGTVDVNLMDDSSYFAVSNSKTKLATYEGTVNLEAVNGIGTISFKSGEEKAGLDFVSADIDINASDIYLKDKQKTLDELIGNMEAILSSL